MRKFTKFMLSVAAITAISSAMAVSAMAFEGTYDAATGKVTLSGVESSGDQQTLLVLSEDAATVTEEIIAQIDQDTAISEFILPAGIESATYYVRIGGTNGTIQEYTLEIGGQGVETETIIIGDVNLSGSIDGLDVSNLLRYSNAYTSRIGNAGTVKTKASDSTSIIVGDVNLSGSIDGLDVSNLLRYSNAYTSRIGNAGQEVEVVK